MKKLLRILMSIVVMSCGIAIGIFVWRAAGEQAYDMRRYIRFGVIVLWICVSYAALKLDF